MQSMISYDELSETVQLIILEHLKDLQPNTSVIISSKSSEDWLPFLFSRDLLLEELVRGIVISHVQQPHFEGTN